MKQTYRNNRGLVCLSIGLVVGLMFSLLFALTKLFPESVEILIGSSLAIVPFIVVVFIRQFQYRIDFGKDMLVFAYGKTETVLPLKEIVRVGYTKNRLFRGECIILYTNQKYYPVSSQISRYKVLWKSIYDCLQKQNAAVYYDPCFLISISS